MHKLNQKDVVYPFACTSCGFNACNQENILAHIKIHTDEKPYPCHICCYRAKNRTGINAHLKRKNHIGIKTVPINYKCGLCNYQTPNPSDLRVHIVGHIRSPDMIRLELICMCNYITKFEDIPIHINDHVKNMHHAEIDKILIRFECNIVNYNGQEENAYNPDTSASRQVNVGNLQAPQVTVPLNYNNYDNHSHPGNIQGPASPNWVSGGACIDQHVNYNPPQPPLNNLPPIHTINGANSMTNHSNLDEGAYMYSVNQTPNVMHEMAPSPMIGTSVKITVDLTCTFCNYVACNQLDLNDHVSTHSTILQDHMSKLPLVYSCCVCSFYSSQESELTIHMGTHVALENDSSSDMIDFTCDICGFMTYSQSDLDLHNLGHTNNDETIECNECKCQLASEVDLQFHMIIHSQSETSPENFFQPTDYGGLHLKNQYDQHVLRSEVPSQHHQFVQSMFMDQDPYASLPHHI